MSANNATSNSNTLEVVISSPTAQSTSASNQTKPTVLDHYCQYLDRAERYRDLDPQTLSTLRSHLRKMAHLFEISARETLDINSEAMLGLLEQMEVLFESWATEGKAHRTILDYQRLFVSAICKAREGEGAPSDEARKTLNNRLNRIRRPSTPPIAKPWSPEDEDIERLYQYANDIIDGKVERPFGRYNAKTGEWTKRMPHNKVVMIRAAITIEAAMAGRTMEIRDIKKSWVKDGQITRVVSKKREPKDVLAKIRPDLWKYVEAWLEVAPKNQENLFPYASSTFSNIISAFMRQAGWKGRNLGLYALRRWGLTRLQEKGKSDHVIMAVSQHRSRESMKAYLSDAAEQRLGDEGRSEIQSLLAELIHTAGEEDTDLTLMLEELKRVRNLFSADAVKSMMQMNDDADSLGKERSDYIVERAYSHNGTVVEVNFSLDEDAAVETGVGTDPVLRHGADRFTQRIGGSLNSIRPVGPPVPKHGEVVDSLEGDDFKENGWFGGGMTLSRQKGDGAGGRIRTCEPLRNGT